MQNSVRGNTVPQGGVFNPISQGVITQGLMLPDTLQIKQAANIFHENADFNRMQLDRVNLTPGAQTMIRLQNVGLGEYLDIMVQGAITLDNNNGNNQVIDITPTFPFNLLTNIQTMFNGKVMLTNVSGEQLVAIMAKRYPRSPFMFSELESFITPGAGAIPVHQPRVDRSIAWVQLVPPAGDAVSAIAPGNTLTGAGQVTLKAQTQGIVLNFGFFLRLPFTLREDLPLGLIPMQNNNIYATVTLQTNTILGPSQLFPLDLLASANVAVAQTNIFATPVYAFWGIPSNPSLYEFFCNNSYLLTNYPRNPFNNQGANAIRFNYPNNYYLVSSLFVVRDANGDLVNTRAVIDNPHIVFNGTTVVDNIPHIMKQAQDMIENGRILPQGMFIFDGSRVVDRDANSADTGRWLNMYTVNNPMFQADVTAAIPGVPGQFDVCLEQVVPNYVKIM